MKFGKTPCGGFRPGHVGPMKGGFRHSAIVKKFSKFEVKIKIKIKISTKNHQDQERAGSGSAYIIITSFSRLHSSKLKRSPGGAWYGRSNSKSFRLPSVIQR